MREKIAILLCGATISVTLALSVLFATRGDGSRSKAPPAIPAPQMESQQAHDKKSITGRSLFETQHCGTCHSFAGVGNPRLPLDGIGQKMSDQEMQNWITGSGAATNTLSAFIIKRKQGYKEMPEEQMRLLIAYLRGGQQ